MVCSRILTNKSVIKYSLPGFIGSHAVDQTLRAGYRVRAAVRSVEKANLVKSFFDKIYPGQIECVIVEDISKQDAYLEAIRGIGQPPFTALYSKLTLFIDVAGVIHLAAVMPRRESFHPPDILPPS